MQVNTFGYSQLVDASWRGLMAAVIVQAVADLKNPNPVTALDAALFLTGDDFALWAEAVGVPDLDGIQFLISGQARKVSRIRKT